MKNAWNSVIFMKSNKSMDEMNAMAKWDGIESMWHTSGMPWDWCVKLDKSMSAPEKAEEMVQKMRAGHWATETATHWWKQVSE